MLYPREFVADLVEALRKHRGNVAAVFAQVRRAQRERQFVRWATDIWLEELNHRGRGVKYSRTDAQIVVVAGWGEASQMVITTVTVTPRQKSSINRTLTIAFRADGSESSRAWS